MAELEIFLSFSLDDFSAYLRAFFWLLCIPCLSFSTTADTHIHCYSLITLAMMSISIIASS